MILRQQKLNGSLGCNTSKPNNIIDMNLFLFENLDITKSHGDEI